MCPAVADVRQEAKDVARGPFGEAVARWGLVSKGALYLLVGVIAADVAVAGGERLRDRGGAVSAVADTWYGKVIIFLVAIGLAGYAAWRFAQGVLGRPLAGGKKESWWKRIGYYARSGWYLFLLWVVLAALAGADEEGGSKEEDRATARVLDWPLGRWILVKGGARCDTMPPSWSAATIRGGRPAPRRFSCRAEISSFRRAAVDPTILCLVM